MEARLIDHMGSDLSVVRAARVSHNNDGDKWREDGADERLIRFLARNGHWTPFGHTSLTIRCEAPLFVARQLAKHQVGLVWNETSRRYVDDPPRFYVPDQWRQQDEDIKQGSKQDEFVKTLTHSNGVSVEVSDEVEAAIDTCVIAYLQMLKAGVCKEQARMILPQSMYTSWYWTGSIIAFSRICNLRTAPDTQKETRDIAEDIAGICSKTFPISWEALTGKVKS